MFQKSENIFPKFFNFLLNKWMKGSTRRNRYCIPKRNTTDSTTASPKSNLVLRFVSSK
jgi:hypothetical protein